MHVPSGTQNLKTERLISHKCLIFRKLINVGMFLNFRELVRGCLLSILGNFAYSFQGHEQEMTQFEMVLQSKLN